MQREKRLCNANIGSGEEPVRYTDPNGKQDLGDYMDDDPTGMSLLNDVGTQAIQMMGSDFAEGFNDPLSENNSTGVLVGKAIFFAAMAIPGGGEAKITTAVLRATGISALAGASFSVATSGNPLSKDAWVKAGIVGAFTAAGKLAGGDVGAIKGGTLGNLLADEINGIKPNTPKAARNAAIGAISSKYTKSLFDSLGLTGDAAEAAKAIYSKAMGTAIKVLLGD